MIASFHQSNGYTMSSPVSLVFVCQGNSQESAIALENGKINTLAKGAPKNAARDRHVRRKGKTEADTCLMGLRSKDVKSTRHGQGRMAH